MTNGDIVFLSNSPFFVDRMLRLSFQVVLTRERAWISFRYFKICSFFQILQISVELVHYTFAWEPNEFFRGVLEHLYFAFGGKVLDCLENREILCGHCLKFSNVATVQVCRILRFFLEFNILTN